jgi:hypothetical protein
MKQQEIGYWKGGIKAVFAWKASLLITSLHQEGPRKIHLEGFQETSASIN